jgi:(p)ppGpp synthase/HD superfamily hydrolase
MSKYLEFIASYRSLTDRSEQTLARIARELRQHLTAKGIDANCERRLKSPESAWRKTHLYGLGLDQIHDLFGARVLVGDVDECYRVLNAVRDAWPGMTKRFKDYIISPKDNGYQSLHTTVTPPGAPPFEIQIRTFDMHLDCQTGLAAHWKYKRSASPHAAA